MRPAAALAVLLALGFAGPAPANDRPFQSARTAVREDDAYVWSFETWVQRFGGVRGVSIEPEYTFDAGTSVQLELTRLVDRAGFETGQEGEIELKHVFNDIARDGWGAGLSVAFGAARSHETGTTRAVALKLPLSIAIGEGWGYVHLNAGVAKAEGERRSFLRSAALEHKLAARTLLFAEWAVDAERTFVQVGARRWLRRERFAIDVALQQQRSEGRRGAGILIGLGWYDL